jgi:hypothetical protein
MKSETTAQSAAAGAFGFGDPIMVHRWRKKVKSVAQTHFLFSCLLLLPF